MPLEEFLDRLRRIGIVKIGGMKIGEDEIIFLGRPDEVIFPFICTTHPIHVEPEIYREIILSVLRRFKIDNPEAFFPKPN